MYEPSDIVRPNASRAVGPDRGKATIVTGERQATPSSPRTRARLEALAGQARFFVQNQCARISRLTPEPLSNALLTTEARGQIDQLESRFRDQIVASALAEFRAERELRRFRTENQLEREAAYRPSVLLQIGLIALTLVFETVLNGVLFARVNPLGLIGGAAQALILSLANVSTGLLLGLIGIRLACHRQWRLRVFGWLASLCLVSFGFFWNLYVAHLRNASELLAAAQRGSKGHNLTQAPANALDLMISSPFDFSSSDSIALLVLGLLIFGFATIEGRSGLADPYWGYKARDQGLADARADHGAMKERYRRALSRVLEQNGAHIDRIMASDQQKMDQIQLAQAQAARYVQARYEKACQIRTRTAPDAPPMLNLSTLPDNIVPHFPDSEPCRDAAREAEAIIIANRDKAGDVKRNISDLTRAAQSGLEPLIAAAEAEARQRLQAEWGGAPANPLPDPGETIPSAQTFARPIARSERVSWRD